MKTINKLVYILIAAFIFNACDVIDAPYEENGGNSVQKPKKNVLIEDFTGFRCGNCPPAAVEAARIIDENEGRVFAMAIHVGVLASPTQSHPYDFRTAVGDDIDANYGISLIGTPLGLINRSEYEDKYTVQYVSWEDAVNQQLQQTTDMTIEMESSLNTATNTITVNPKLIYYDDVKSGHVFNIYITESKIIEYQKWYNHDPDDIEDYEHNHVLRDAFYGAWGNDVSSLFSGTDTLTAELTYTISNDKDWNPENINLIGVVMDKDNNYEILQVMDVHLNE